MGRSYPCMSIADDLSKWYFNTMCGLGDKEHNRLLSKQNNKSDGGNSIEENI